MPDDGSAVPREFVPGAAALVPSAPPLAIDMCDPPPPRADAAPGSARQTAMQRNESGLMARTPRVVVPGARARRRARLDHAQSRERIVTTETGFRFEAGQDDR